MKSIDICEMGYGDESKSKSDNISSRQLNEGDSMKTKRRGKSSTTGNDSICDIEICEVVGNVEDCTNDNNPGDDSRTSEEGRSFKEEKPESEACKEDDCEDVDGMKSSSVYSNTKRNGKKKKRELLLDSSEPVPTRKNKVRNCNFLVNDIKNSDSLESSLSCVRNSNLDVENSLGECERNEGETRASDGPGPEDERQMRDSISPCERLIENKSEKIEEGLTENYGEPPNADESTGVISSEKEISESCRGDDGNVGGTFTGEEENKENETTNPKREGNRKVRHKKEYTPNRKTSVWENGNDENSEFYPCNENNIDAEDDAEEEEEEEEGDGEDGVIICEVNVEETTALDYDKNTSLTDSEKTEVSDVFEGQEGKSEEREEEEIEDPSNRKRYRSEIAEVEGVAEKKRKTWNKEKENNELIDYPRRNLPETDDAGEGNCDGFRAEDEELEKSRKSEENNENSLSSKNTSNDENGGNEELMHSLPFVESLRDSIKSLSKGDLEELIVQKLCEVITERSNVGLLRKKAEALEQDQERWKEKVHSLTKQIREMDMVMKKYMSEVEKQNKERNFQVVAPLRVTRSVGLQVSFTANNYKMSKGGVKGNQKKNGLPSSENQEDTGKQSQQQTVFFPQNTKKNAAVLPAGQKKQYSPTPGVDVTFQAGLITSQNVVPQNRGSQPQSNPVIRPKPPSPDQNNSKIIDLTEDDDRQSNQVQNSEKAVLQSNVSVRPPGQIRVVNHIQPGQVNSAGRVAYLVPASSTTASGGVGSPQSRQLLIATPTVPAPPRHILPSVPPLLYKGCTILQSGSQQPATISPSNRATISKSLKHPAPLPQPPQNQIQKPNWKLLPPRPALKISKVHTGIVLSWNMTLGPEYEPIASYQLYAYQENNCPPATSLWKKVGDVKALPLPMACTLTQFMSGHKYYFAVRAVDLHSRIGPFSFPGSIVLIK